MAENNAKSTKTRIGLVVSDKMSKSCVVSVETIFKHRLYKKVVRRTKRYLADDPTDQCKVGDKVMIEETRPLSARKRWRVSQVLEQGK